MSTFRVVSDELQRRRGTGSRLHAAWIDAVLGGQTVFLPGRRAEQAHGSAGRVRRAGYRLHSYSAEVDGERGLVVWAEKAEMPR